MFIITFIEFIVMNNWIRHEEHLFDISPHKIGLSAVLSAFYVLINHLYPLNFYRDMVIFVLMIVYVLTHVLLTGKKHMNTATGQSSNRACLADNIMRGEIFTTCGIIANALTLLGWNLFTDLEDTVLFSNKVIYLGSLIIHVIFVCICLYFINLYVSSSCKHFSYCLILFANMLCIELLLTLNQKLPSYPRYIKILLYLCTIFLSITSIFFIIFFSKNEAVLKKSAEDETRLYILSENAKNYDAMLSVSEKIRQWQHDQKNHYMIINNMIQNGNYRDALKYINNLDDNLDNSVFNSVNTGNPVIDAVLSQKLQTINDGQIEFDYSIFIPDNFSLPQVTFSSILCNIFDNAIEACARLPVGNRKIMFSIKPHGKMILIELTNSSNGRYLYNNGILQSSKNSRHGLGLTILKELVEESGGFCTYMPSPDEFTVKIVLPACREEI